MSVEELGDRQWRERCLRCGLAMLGLGIRFIKLRMSLRRVHIIMNLRFLNPGSQYVRCCWPSSATVAAQNNHLAVSPKIVAGSRGACAVIRFTASSIQSKGNGREASRPLSIPAKPVVNILISQLRIFPRDIWRFKELRTISDLTSTKTLPT